MKQRRQRGTVSNIDTFEYNKFGVKLNISLNKETGQFFAEYAGSTFYNAKLEDLKSKLYATVTSMSELSWIPVIKVIADGNSRSITDVLNDDMHNDEYYQRDHMLTEGDVKLHAERFWLAQRKDGKWVACEIWNSLDYAVEGLTPEQYAKKHGFKGTFCTVPHDRRLNVHDFYEARNMKDFALPYSANCNFHGDPRTHFIPYSDAVWDALNVIADKIGLLSKQLEKLVGTPDGRVKLSSFASKLLTDGKKTGS